MSSSVVIAVLNHLWQSTLLAGAAAGLTLLMRRNSARLRYLTWLAASLKFLVPLAWLVALGTQIPWPGGLGHGAGVSLAGQMMQSIMLPGGQGASGIKGAAHVAGSGLGFPIVFAALWALGAAAVGARWLSRWRALRREVLQSGASDIAFVIPVRRCSTQLEPAVVGVFRPVLLLPDGLEGRLQPAELNAILAHERCHAMWRDNLTAAVHMLVEVLFWFHPLVWWLGARLITERERACDEQVLAKGHAPREYAEGILKVCEHFLQSPVPCAAGVGGASLKHRIEDIMNNRWIEKLSGFKKACVITLACGVVVAPITFGLLTAPRAQAQAASPSEAAFSNVSIQASTMSKEQCSPGAGGDAGCSSFMFRPGGKVEIKNATLQPLIAAAYGVQESLVLGRQWSDEPRYNITADASFGPGPAASAALRDLLARRFGVAVKHQLRQMNGYVLMLSSSGSKLKATQFAPGTPRMITLVGPDGKAFNSIEAAQPLSPAQVRGWQAVNMPLGALAGAFSSGLNVPVADETGLQGDYAYTYRVDWQPGAGPDVASLDKALEEQLGLHLEARAMNVDAIEVISVKPAQEVLTAQR